MQCFYIENFPGANVCMHCSTEEEARTFLEFLDSVGRRWCNGQSYLEITHFDSYFENTVYFFNNGTYCNTMYAARETCSVLEFADFSFPKSFNDEGLEVDEQPLDDFFSAFSLCS